MNVEYKEKLDSWYGSIPYVIIHEWEQDGTVFVICSSHSKAYRVEIDQRSYFRIFPIQGNIMISQDYQEDME